MPLLHGALTGQFLRTDPDPPSRTALVDALSAHAFREPAADPRDNAVIGWVSPDNWLETDIPAETTFAGAVAHLRLRIDRKKLPPRAKEEIRQRIERWCRENHRERAPVSVRQELKEIVEASWWPRIVPQTKIVDVLWATDEGFLVVGAEGDALEWTRKMLHRLGHEIDRSFSRMDPLDHLAPRDARRLVARWGGASVPDGDAADEPLDQEFDRSLPAEAGRDFLRYVWSRCNEGGTFEIEDQNGSPWEIWIGASAVLGNRRDTKATPHVRITDERLPDAHEVRAGLEDGERAFLRLEIEARRNELEYRLLLDAQDLQPKNWGLPSLLAHEREEAILERIFEIQHVLFLLGLLLRSWARDVLDHPT